MGGDGGAQEAPVALFWAPVPIPGCSLGSAMGSCGILGDAGSWVLSAPSCTRADAHLFAQGLGSSL